jgi:hypothetical protein
MVQTGAISENAVVIGTLLLYNEAQVLIPSSSLFAVFGASGDLAKKSTFPALYTLWEEGLLPESKHHTSRVTHIRGF